MAVDASSILKRRASKFKPDKTLPDNVASKLSTSDLFNLQFVGTALPGTSKGPRGRDIASSAALSRNKAFRNISSAGGFTILGKNAFGQDVARDNATGRVATVNSFNPISPKARALGEQPTPKSISTSGQVRRKNRPSTGSGTSTGRKPKKDVLGTSSILGTQSILG